MNKPQSLKMACLLCAVLLQALTSGAQPVTKVAAGFGHSLFLKSDGSLWAMGYDDYGQLGDGISTGLYPNDGTNLPAQIVASNVTAIAGGFGLSMFIKNDGSLWDMGWNYYGQLGDSNDYFFFETNLPEQIVASNVTAISVGEMHSLFLKSDGSLWGIGLNIYGQLGDGTYNDTNQPEQIMASNVTAIAAGAYHSLFIKSDGSLWAMGINNDGQLGDGTTDNGIYRTNLPEQIVASNVTAIAAGGISSITGGGPVPAFGHSLFLKSDGSLWAMGLNNAGQLGDGTYNNTNRPEMIVASNVTAIAAGGAHSLFLKSDGSLWGMGGNDGSLGDGTYNNTNRPEQIVATGVIAIAAGGGHSMFIRSDGSLWVMGANFNGQLGDGTFNTTNRPEEIVVNPTYNQIFGQLLGTGGMQLSFVGVSGANYALDRSTSLAPPNWVPQTTNPANSFGALVFTNTPCPATNNFWRIRSVP